MSWFLSILLFVIPALLLFYFYFTRRITAALHQLTAWPIRRLRWGMRAVAAYLLLYPLLLLIANIFRLPSLNYTLSGAEKWANLFVTFPFWIGMVVILEYLPLLLVIDVSSLLFRPFFKKYRTVWIKWQAIISLALLALVIVYVSARVMHDTYSIRLAKHEVPIANLPGALEGFRLVQLSDLQADFYTDASKMQAYIELAKAQNPDLIVFCGDLVTRGTDHVARGAEMMGRLRARLGVYACLGDHDYWANPQLVTQQLQSHHVVTPEDSVLTLAASPDKISLTILTNVYNRRPARETLQRLRHQRNDSAAVHLMLAHQPTDDLIQFARDHGYHLLLAGHTHGGQVVFKPFGIPLCVSQTETPYYSGFYQLGNVFLSVTNGLGLTFAPLRYQAPAEVTLIVLQHKS